jgi:hypothetical protein
VYSYGVILGRLVSWLRMLQARFAVCLCLSVYVFLYAFLLCRVTLDLFRIFDLR